MDVHNTPLVSVIIPCYNGSSFITRCLSSVLKQTYSNLEVIVIDDGSIDNSLDRLKTYQDPRVTILQQPQNRGLSHTRNVGLKFAKGTFISFIDIDDYIDPHFYEALVSEAIRSSADIVMAEMKIVNSRYTQHLTNTELRTTQFHDKLRALHNGSTCDKLFRADLLNQYNITFYEGAVWEDNLFLIQSLFFSRTFSSITTTCYYYTTTSTSITHTIELHEKRKQDSLVIAEKIISFANQNNIEKTIYTDLTNFIINQIISEKDLADKTYYNHLTMIIGYNEKLYKLHRKYLLKAAFQKIRHMLGTTILGPEYRRIKKELAIAKDFDYKSAYFAYKKYALEIIEEPRTHLEFPAPEQPYVSVIIPVYNQYKYTMRCLQSLLDTTTDISYEVIIGDDNSADATKDILQHVKNITVVKNTTAQGFLTNCNHAAKQASGKYIYLLNNDTQLFTYTVSALACALDADPSLVIVGSKCIFPDAHLQSAGAHWGKKARTHNRGYRDNPLKINYNNFCYVDYCIGASLMVRRDFWEKENGFDEQFAPGYYEETDLCARAKLRGLRVGYQPKSEIIHFTNITFGKQSKLAVQNQAKFYQKWKNFLDLA